MSVKVNFAANDAGFTSTVKKVNDSMKGMDDGVKKASSSVNSSFGSMAKAGAALAIGFGAIKLAAQALRSSFGVFNDSVQNASNLGETISKVGEIFGEGKDEIQAWAKTAAQSLGQSKTQAMDAAAQFAIFGKAAGLSGDNLTGFSTELVELAADLASFNNATPEEAILAIGSALRGEAEPMRRFGVLLDDASLRNEALKMGLIATTKEALTPQQKVLAAHALIMAQTSVAQGDFARTSGGLANQQRILAANMADLSTELGSAFLPFINKLVVAFNDQAIPAMQHFSSMFSGVDSGKWADGLLSSIGTIADALIGAFKSPMAVIEALGFELLSLGANFMNTMAQSFNFVKDIGTQVFQLLSEQIAGTFGKAFSHSWDLFTLYGQKALISLEKSKEMQSFLAGINTIFDGIMSKSGDNFDFDATFEKYKNAGVDANNEISNTLDARIKQATEDLAHGLSSGSDEISEKWDKIKGFTGGVKEDIFGAGESSKIASEKWAEVSASGKKFKEELMGVKEAFDMSKDFSQIPLLKWSDMMKDGASHVKDASGAASKAASEMKQAVSESAKMLEQIKNADAADSKGGRIQEKFKEAIGEGNLAGARRQQRNMERNEIDESIKKAFGGKDAKSLNDIAKKEGIDTFGKSSRELRKELADKAKDRQGEMVPGKGGKPGEVPGQPKAADNPMDAIRKAVDVIQKLVEKIEPKLPTAALGV